jgi:hypothetical protein
MPRLFLAAALAALAACTPTYNWREVGIDPTGLQATLPCKPDRAERKTEFTPGRELVLHAVGCEAGGAAFAVLYADMGQMGDLASALAQWKGASLAATHSKAQSEQPYLPAGALGLAQSALVRAQGQRPDGSTVQSQAAYFARGTRVFQAVVYAERLDPKMTEPFFAGLRFE